MVFQLFDWDYLYGKPQLSDPQFGENSRAILRKKVSVENLLFNRRHPV